MASESYERVIMLEQRVLALEARLQVVYHALVAHAGDTEAHPCSHNKALTMLRALAANSPSEAKE